MWWPTSLGLALLLSLAASGAACRVVGGAAVRASESRDGRLALALVEGDTALVEIPDGSCSEPRVRGAVRADCRGGRYLRLVAPPGSGGTRSRVVAHRGWFWGRHPIDLDLLPRRGVEVRLVPVGADPVPLDDPMFLAALSAEVSRLWSPVGVVVAVRADPPEGTGGTGTVRLLKGTPGDRGGPQAEALVGALARRGVRQGRMALLQDSVTVAWTLASPAPRGAAEIEVAGDAAPAWRDLRGGIVAFALLDDTGAVADTLRIERYRGGGRVRIAPPLTRSHPAGAALVRLGSALPAFGFGEGNARVLVWPDARRPRDPFRAARSLSLEIARAWGLADGGDARETLSPFLNLEANDPVWRRDQWRTVARLPVSR